LKCAVDSIPRELTTVLITTKAQIHAQIGTSGTSDVSAAPAMTYSSEGMRM
jgi:hypothetical protein